jgi:anti-anti-sigma regulatory factor
MVAVSGQVRESFKVTRLDRVFRFFETLDAAQSALG